MVAQRLFAWLPAWYLRPIDIDAIGRYSASAWSSAQAVYAWLWGETALSGRLRAIRDRPKASGAPALDQVAFGIAR